MFCISLLFHKIKKSLLKNIVYTFLSVWNACLSRVICLRIVMILLCLSLLPTPDQFLQDWLVFFIITIGLEKCFNVFENRFSTGLGTLSLSEIMDEIRGTGVFLKEFGANHFGCEWRSLKWNQERKLFLWFTIQFENNVGILHIVQNWFRWKSGHFGWEW